MGSDYLYEYGTWVSDTTGVIICASPYQGYMGSFVPQKTHFLTSVDLKLKRVSTVGGSLTVSLRAIDPATHKPTGGDLRSDSMANADISTSATTYNFAWSGMVVEAGVEYAICVFSNGGDATHNIRFLGGSVYSYRMYQSVYSGGAWGTVSANQRAFYEYGLPDPISNAAATDITFSGATLNGSLPDPTGIDEIGFDYGTVAGTYTDEVTQSGSFSPGTQSLAVTGLEPSRAYYFRFKVHHTTYGWLYASYSPRGELSFQTLNDPTWRLYEKQNTVNSGEQIISTSIWYMTSFTPAYSHNCKAIRVRVRNYTTYDNLGLMTLSIRATDPGTGKPTWDDLITSTIPTVWISSTGTGEWWYFGLGDGILLDAATVYAIVLRIAGGDAGSHNCRWRFGTGYAGGGVSISTDSGSTWGAVNYSQDFMFEDWGENGVQTYPATNVEATTATGNGFTLSITDVDLVGFEWGTTEGGPYPYDETEAVPPTAGAYTGEMTGLSGSTVYYYRAKIHNTVEGWLYGNEQSFTTKPPTPTVRTRPPTDAQIDHIDAVGYIESIGAENCDRRGFVYGLTSLIEPLWSTDAPEDTGYDASIEEEGDFGVGSFTLKIPNLEASRIYYIRAWAHNSFGYDYGSEIVVVTNPNVNILSPSSDASKGIRFDTSPGGGYPHPGMGTIDHYLLVRSKDTRFNTSYGYFGAFYYCQGVYEYNYYNDNYYTDLYGLANPYRREENIIKVKYKCRTFRTTYPYGSRKRELLTHGVQYTGVTAACGVGEWGGGDYCEIFYDNLNTSLPWTLAEADALQVGITLGNGGGFGLPFCDWVEARVLWANAAVRVDPGQKLSATELRLNGFVLEDEAEECQVYFEWGLTTGYGNETTPETKRINQFFSADISGLDPLETYHYRAVIETACGETFYSEDAAFNMYRPDRIYVWLGDAAEAEAIELTDPAYPMALAARTERGWDEELAQASAGIAEVVCDNYYGDFNPEKVGGAYYGDLALGKWLTIYEQYKGVKYPHFTGKIQKILPNDDPNDPTAYILAVDGMDDIASTKVSTVLRQDTDVGELADDALDACNWPAGARDIDAGVDTLEFGWFHKRPGLDAFRALETTEKGRFFIKRDGDARFENRHYRITGSGLISQATFQDTAVRIQYEWSKRLLYNDIQVTGRRYTAGGVQLFSGYDLAALDAGLVWSAHTGDAAAPYIPQSSTVTLWAEFGSPISSYDALVEGTHWNANTSPDKSGDDVGANINITITQYGQALKLVIENTGSMGAYLVEPDSPPDPSETEDRTLLIYGVLFGSENVTVIEEDQTSQDDYGKRTLEVDAPFKSRPNDILAYAQWLKARYHLPIPNPVQVIHVARTNWPEDTIRIQCLVREISDRITVASTKLGFDRDFYINKVIQEYAMNEGGMVHDTTWVVEQAEGSAEGLYWLLGVAGFGELGEATILGF